MNSSLQIATYRDSRGLAYALLGRKDEAIQDSNFYIDQHAKRQAGIHGKQYNSQLASGKTGLRLCKLATILLMWIL